MIYNLNLPKPSNELIKLVTSVATNRPVNYESKRWHQTIQDTNVNCAAGEFFGDADVAALAKKELAPYINIDFSPAIGIIRNVESNGPACYPPHTDRVRTVAINYYIKSGGSNVKTFFYDQCNSEKGHVLPYSQLRKVDECCFDTDSWYVFDTTQYHSVENIESERIILTLSIKNTELKDVIKVFERPTIFLKDSQDCLE